MTKLFDINLSRGISRLLMLVKMAAVLVALGLLFMQSARADYVGELETTKYFDPDTINNVILPSLASGGLKAGQQISYFIQFTPTDNGGNIGGGGFVTDYIPAGTRVVDAKFVHLNSDGSYTQIAPPLPAAVYPAYVPMYSDTGIFYSTDARTAVYPATGSITAANGYALSGVGCNGISLPSTTHNAWDRAMMKQFSGAAPDQGGTCAAPPATDYTDNNSGGLSPVAGPDTYLTIDDTGATGPWHRISYPGSMKGTATGAPVTGSDRGTTVTGCVGGAATSAGWNFATDGPLPSNTTAVRFAAGKVSVGELFTARITLQLTSDMPAAGIVNNSEVFGGDISLDLGNAGGYPSLWSQWRYHCPAVATSNSNLLVLKNLVGACTGSGCTPTGISAGVVPSAANLKLRYTIQYVNLGGTAQTNVKLTDKLASGAAYVTGSYSLLSGTGPGAPTGTTTLTFPTIVSLGSGAGGNIQYDVNIATAPADGKALINTATLVSTQIPSPGVTSKAIATVSSQANLWISKATTTPSVTSGSNVSYTITIPNNGKIDATKVVVNDYLPSTGGVTGTTVNDRFSYVAGSAVVKITTVAGGVTTITPTSITNLVATAAPYAGLNRERLVVTLPTTTAIPMFGKLTITFNATAGSNVPASDTPYLNDANVWYAGGPGGTGANSSYSETIGTAPVTVTAPVTLSVKVNCVYALLTSTPSKTWSSSCAPYTNGPIVPGSKVKYELDYKNISASAVSSLVLSDTLPPNTTYATGTASLNGVAPANLVTPIITGSNPQLLTFPTIASLAAGASGYLTFDADVSNITTGTDITDIAKVTGASFTAGVTATVTTSILSLPLQVTKIVTSPAAVSPAVGTIQPGGSVTYSITVKNTGTSAVNGITVYDELPWTGATSSSATRFSYASAGTFTFTDATPASGTSVTMGTLSATTVPPTYTGYTTNANQQELKWSFGAQSLAPGASFTVTYTATAGSAVPGGATYTSDVLVTYNTTAVAAAYNTAGVSVNGLDHYEISVPPTSINCLPTIVTITACANASNPCAGTNIATGIGGSATLTSNPGGLVASSVTLASGVGTTTLSYPTAADGAVATVSIATVPTAASKAATCANGTGCATTFNKAGFIVSATSGGAVATIATQVAGVSSGTYYLRAVKTSDNSAHTCDAAFKSVTAPVNFGYECNDPASCYASDLMSVNGGTATTIARNNSGSASNSTPVSMTFDSNGNAPFTLNYSDVGQVTLWVNATVANGALLMGASNPFLVKPDHFAVDICNATTSGNCPINTSATPTDGSGTILAVAGTAATQAGAAFKATVRSMSSTGSITPSFGTAGSVSGSNATETVALTHTCVAPSPAPCAGSAATSLAGTKSFMRSAFSSGINTVSDLTWDEVGVITLTATGSNFMGVGPVSGTSAPAGRFIPDHFDTAVAGQMACAAGVGCAAPITEMVYSGQVVKTVTVLVKNANNAQTRNYQGGFAKDVTLSAVDVVGGAGTPAGGNLGGTNTVTAIAFDAVGGKLTGSVVANTGAPMFTFSTNPTIPTDLYMRAIDTDAVTSKRTASSIEGGVKVVSGRVKIPNVYGSELLPLPITVTVQYYRNAAERWVTSTTDSVTSFDTSTDIVASIVKGPLAGITVQSPGVVTVGSGVKTFTLNRPDVAGSADICLKNPIWLMIDGSLACGGSLRMFGRVTFGIYKSPLIYRRENY